jgi:putative sulfurtransferase DndC
MQKQSIRTFCAGSGRAEESWCGIHPDSRALAPIRQSMTSPPPPSNTVRIADSRPPLLLFRSHTCIEHPMNAPTPPQQLELLTPAPAARKPRPSAFAEHGFRATVAALQEEIRALYTADDVPWIVGYSGGKDSTATLQLIWSALAELPEPERRKTVHVISTDTLVENPVVSAWVRNAVKVMRGAAESQRMPCRPRMLEPKLEDRFWVNLIGRGYPAPRHKFRWCTERLKILPSNNFIQNIIKASGQTIIALGTRKAESSRRAATMLKHEAGRERARLSPNKKLPGSLVYSVIEDWSNDDVWFYLMQDRNPWGYDNRELLGMYAGASEDGECPLVVDDSTPSCGDSRFGCWVCTLVEQDKSMAAMIQNDEEKEWMMPLLDLRNALDFRDGPKDVDGFSETDRHLRDFRRMSGRARRQRGRVPRARRNSNGSVSATGTSCETAGGAAAAERRRRLRGRRPTTAAPPCRACSQHPRGVAHARHPAPCRPHRNADAGRLSRPPPYFRTASLQTRIRQRISRNTNSRWVFWGIIGRCLKSQYHVPAPPRALGRCLVPRISTSMTNEDCLLPKHMLELWVIRGEQRGRVLFSSSLSVEALLRIAAEALETAASRADSRLSPRLVKQLSNSISASGELPYLGTIILGIGEPVTFLPHKGIIGVGKLSFDAAEDIEIIDGLNQLLALKATRLPRNVRRELTLPTILCPLRDRAEAARLRTSIVLLSD